MPTAQVYKDEFRETLLDISKAASLKRAHLTIDLDTFMKKDYYFPIMISPSINVTKLKNSEALIFSKSETNVGVTHFDSVFLDIDYKSCKRPDNHTIDTLIEELKTKENMSQWRYIHYTSGGGFRIIYKLDEPMEVSIYSSIMKAVIGTEISTTSFSQLTDENGVIHNLYDKSCYDTARFFNPPSFHCIREDGTVKSNTLALSQLRFQDKVLNIYASKSGRIAAVAAELAVKENIERNNFQQIQNIINPKSKLDDTDAKTPYPLIDLLKSHGYWNNTNNKPICPFCDANRPGGSRLTGVDIYKASKYGVYTIKCHHGSCGGVKSARTIFTVRKHLGISNNSSINDL